MMKTANEFVVTRTVNAPIQLVWDVYTKAEHLGNWWGPKGFKIHVSKLELKPNGIFHYYMETPDGHRMWGKFVYHEIVAPEKLVFVNSFSDENGNSTRHPMSPTWPLEVYNVLTLEEKDGKTTINLRGKPYNASEEEIKTFEDGFSSMQQGFKGTLDHLEEYLAEVQK